METLENKSVSDILWVEIVPVASLSLPYLLCKDLREQPIYSLLSFFLFGSIFFFYLSVMLKRDVCMPYFVQVIYRGRFLIRMSVYYLLFLYLLKKEMMQAFPVFLLCIPFICVLIYSMKGDDVVRERFLKISFYRIIIPLVLILLIAIVMVRPEAIFTIANERVTKPSFVLLRILLRGYACVSLLLPMELLFFLKRKVRRGMLFSYGFVFLSLLFIIFVLIGVSGPWFVGRSILSLYENMQMLNVPGGIFYRVDILAFGIFMYGFFALISAYARCVVGDGFSLSTKWGDEKKEGEKYTSKQKNRYGVIILATVLFILSFFYRYAESVFEIYIRLVMWVGLPLSFLMPLFFKKRSAQTTDSKIHPNKDTYKNKEERAEER